MATANHCDAFLSYAVEDKIGIVNELDSALTAKGLNIWYAGRELKVGDPVTERIQEGLEQCRFGIIIISPTYLDKVWGLFELFTLLHMKKDIFPILHDMTIDEFIIRAPMLQGRFLLQSNKGIPYITEELFKKITTTPVGSPEVPIEIAAEIKPSRRKWIIGTVALTLIAVSSFFGYTSIFREVPQRVFIESEIKKRINDLQQKADLQQQQLISVVNSKPVPANDVNETFAEFKNAKSYYRNEYELNTGVTLVHSRTQVQKVMQVNLEDFSPLNTYSLTSPAIYRAPSSTANGYREEHYAFYSNEPVTYSFSASGYDDGDYQVTVSYQHPIRLVQTTLIFPSASNNTKRYQVTFTALTPSETFVFERHDDNWRLKTIQ